MLVPADLCMHGHLLQGRLLILDDGWTSRLREATQVVAGQLLG